MDIEEDKKIEIRTIINEIRVLYTNYFNLSHLSRLASNLDDSVLNKKINKLTTDEDR